MILSVRTHVFLLASTPGLFAQVRLTLADAVSEALAGHPQLAVATARAAATVGLQRQAGLSPHFLTNNFALPALTIARLYQARWQVELFFKWIKQHLRIKVFYGTSENAVKTQIRIAVSAYVLVAIARKRLELDSSLYQILQILSLNAFRENTHFTGLSVLATPKAI